MGAQRKVVMRVAGLALVLSSCNLVAGITNDVQRVECITGEDCQPEEPACVDKPEGTELLVQTPGDCMTLVCDGAGRTKVVPAPTDVEDDGNPCTLDACLSATPTHTLMTELPCYSGPAGTRGKGICSDGIQHCTEQGEPVGGCKGQVVPKDETCLYPLDEDCDGQANESGLGCACEPSDVRDCYTGPAGTEGVGICKKGKQTCKADKTGYGPCVGEQIPKSETCDAGMLDEDCDGLTNEEGTDCMCGDGYVSNGEECDDGNTDSSDACTVLCKLPVCGDGFVQQGMSEECDDGNTDSTDACTAVCKLSVCGDGFVQQGMGEECDDGNTDSTDACTALCKPPVCGDGFVQQGMGEECDDGNTDSTDACTAVCKLPVCGDGIVQQGETCDDGNTIPADACPSNCRPPILNVATGSSHTCAMFQDGHLKCWGSNNYGQLGLDDIYIRGNTPSSIGSGLPFVQLGSGKSAKAIALGGDRTCAILNDDLVKCWGTNSYGQLGLGDKLPRGDGPSEMGDALPAVDLGTGKSAIALTAGGNHTCALLNDGSVKCWGFNAYGQLGLGNTLARGDGPNEMGDALPTVNLGAGKSAIAVAAGGNHTCALLNDGSVKCWGFNVHGQLGLGNILNRGTGLNQMGDALPAVDLGTGKSAIAISAGSNHTCALLNDGSVKCWGYNYQGLLGIGDNLSRGDGPSEMGDALPAVDLGTGKSAIALTAADNHTCALLNDGSVKCWGSNSLGQLGIGDTLPRGDGPGEMGDALPAVDLGAGKSAISIAAGYGHTCTVLSDGSGKCWGYNYSGQLGLGDTLYRGDQANEMGDNLPVIP